MSFSVTAPRSLRTWLVVLVAVAFGVLAMHASGAAAATPQTLNLKVLLVGQGPTDVTTAAWAAALKSEGVPYTEVDATGTAPSETITLPALSSGSTGNYNGVIIADSPTNYAAGQLTPLFTYESAFGVRQVDGYMYPSAALGATPATAGVLDGTTGQLTAAGLVAFPGAQGNRFPLAPAPTATRPRPSPGRPTRRCSPTPPGTRSPASTCTRPTPATRRAASPSSRSTSTTTPTSCSGCCSAPGLINWVTKNTHLGLYRNYVEMNIDDTFTPDDAWDTTTHENNYSDADRLADADGRRDLCGPVVQGQQLSHGSAV